MRGPTVAVVAVGQSAAGSTRTPKVSFLARGRIHSPGQYAVLRPDLEDLVSNRPRAAALRRRVSASIRLVPAIWSHSRPAASGYAIEASPV